MPRYSSAILLCAWLIACDDSPAAPTPPPQVSSTTPPAAFSYDPDWKGSDAPAVTSVVVETSAGIIRCELDPGADGPARRRFAAYARGEARYRTRRGWVARRAYDGASFDRTAAGLFVSARPLGAIPVPRRSDGTDEHRGARHTDGGLISVGPEGELALTAGAAPALDAAGMVPIGRCRPVDGIDALSRIPTRFGRPLEPARIERLLLSP